MARPILLIPISSSTDWVSRRSQTQDLLLRTISWRGRSIVSRIERAEDGSAPARIFSNSLLKALSPMFAFAEPLDWLVRGLVLTSLAVLWTLLLVRIVGLRAFSKMTAFDFVTTIATGSLIAQAGTRSDWTSFAQALAAMSGVFAIQWVLAVARKNSSAVSKLIRNKPVLLMENGRFIDEAMTETRTSRANVLEKIRQANVSSLEGVRAVVLETTGNISVLSGDSIDATLFEGVDGAPATFRQVQPIA